MIHSRRDSTLPGTDSWDQHKLSLIYASNKGHWNVRSWIRNIEDNVTGHYLSDDASGLFRNYFLTEPRIYALSVHYQFGKEPRQGTSD